MQLSCGIYALVMAAHEVQIIFKRSGLDGIEIVGKYWDIAVSVGCVEFCVDRGNATLPFVSVAHF
jgi:hypothetical protein